MGDRDIAGEQARASDAPCPAGCRTPARRLCALGEHDIARCPECGVFVLEGDARGKAGLDRTEFEAALRSLRLANYARILRRLEQLVPLRGRTLLDVGCSTGWFLQLAGRAGCECYGIEPDGFFYERLRSAPLPGARIVQGYFAHDVPADWGRFDIISFHDVFEHLPEPAAILHAVRERLAAHGLLVLSLPVADGFVFQLARLLRRLGIAGPLARAFQVNYPYPHLFYFTRRSIRILAERSGFEILRLESLRSFSARGALHRARLDRTDDRLGRLARYASATALVGFAVVQRLLPADNVLVILRPTAA